MMEITARADVNPYYNILRFVMEVGSEKELAFCIPFMEEVIKRAELKKGVILSEKSELETEKPFAMFVQVKFYYANDALEFAKETNELIKKLFT